MFKENNYIMEKIIKKDGYIFLVEGEKGRETFYNLGKDPDLLDKPKKKKKSKT